MKKSVIVNEIEYEIIDNFKDAFDELAFKDKCTDYFIDYDYIVGDIAYNKLRLKGFYNSDNKKVTKINDIKNLPNYFKNNCAVNCRYFVVKKLS